MIREIPIPSHFDPAHAASWSYRPNEMDLFAKAPEWAKAHGVRPSGSDKKKVRLLLIDVQKDFCFPEGTLYVGGRSGRGAIEDSEKIASFIYRNLGVVTDIMTTMDTHFAFQIFFPSFWVDQAGSPLGAHRVVTVDEIRKGLAVPNPAVVKLIPKRDYTWLKRQVEFYCRELERAGKYQLYLWPFHCLLGGDGHALAGVIQEARLFHAFARGSQSWAEVKGGNVLTENYSVLKPEVLVTWDGEALAQKNARFVKTLLESDVVIIAGQAASHCVKSSIDDLLTEIVAVDEKLASKVYIMSDCMSAVAVPDGKGGFIADFTPQAEDAYKRFAAAGMRIVSSKDPIDSWPGVAL
ncbi:MAG: nicotinamidase [Candidatus Sungbacteria bacterium]|nr:nicotinamidase [Candidatus Sungbacteria bacterium]